MNKVLRLSEECLQMLNDILIHPSPQQFDLSQGSVPRTDTLSDLMHQQYQHAYILRKLGRIDEALAAIDGVLARFEEAIGIIREGPCKDMSEAQWAEVKQANRDRLTDQDMLRAVLLSSMGRIDEADAELHRILTFVRRLVAVDQSLSQVEKQAKLSQALVFAGDMQRQRGQIDEALASYEEAAGITSQIYNENPALADRRNRRHISLMRLAGILKSRDLPRARELYAEARKIAEDMVKSDNNSMTAPIALALVSPFSGPPADAVRIAEEILKRLAPGTSPDAELEIDVARVFAAAAEAATIADPPDPESANHWKDRALSLIADAFMNGYRDGVYLNGEPDFASICLVGDFQKLTKP